MHLIVIIFLCIAAITSFVAAQPAEAHEADQHMIISCAVAPQVTDCEAKRSAFRTAYAKAFRNDLAAQRVVAFTLWRGSEVVAADWGPACTWYMTMIALGSPKLQESDFSNMRSACSLLRADQIEIAKNRARALGRRIIAKDKIDTSVPKDDPTLDGTAEPL